MPPSTTGIHHVALTVRDLDASAGWYERVLAISLLFDESAEHRRARVYRLDGTGAMLGLVEHRSDLDDGFRPDRVGLDHLAFAVCSREEMDRWVEHLEAEGVQYSGVIDIPTGAICNFADPDGVQLAVFWEA